MRPIAWKFTPLARRTRSLIQPSRRAWASIVGAEGSAGGGGPAVEGVVGGAVGAAVIGGVVAPELGAESGSGAAYSSPGAGGPKISVGAGAAMDASPE